MLVYLHDSVQEMLGKITFRFPLLFYVLVTTRFLLENKSIKLYMEKDGKEKYDVDDNHDNDDEGRNTVINEFFCSHKA